MPSNTLHIFSFSVSCIYWTPSGPLPPSHTSSVGPNPLSQPYMPPRPSHRGVYFDAVIGVHFTSTVLLVPNHAFNHPLYPFPFTPDGYWALVRPVTLSGASPMAGDPLFYLPTHRPVRNRSVQLFAFKQYLYLFTASNTCWTLLGPLTSSHTHPVVPDPCLSLLTPKTL